MMDARSRKEWGVSEQDVDQQAWGLESTCRWPYALNDGTIARIRSV